jgi:small subunit ribosomal protein S1
VENPREVVQPGDDVKVKILEIETERRRLSLSVKRVEGQILPRRTEGPVAVPEGAGDLDDLPDLALSEDVFAGGAAGPRVDEPEAAPEAEAPEAAAPEAEAAAPEAAAPEADAEASAPEADAAPEAEAADDGEPEPAAARDDQA